MNDSSQQPDKTPAETDLSGRQLGSFRLLRRLGRGAMAEVYLAEQSQLRRRVAVKILKPELADDLTYLRRFEREAQAAAALVHANIVQIYEVGHVDRLHFIAQEHIQGQNLR
jgi:serine/threonine protein kinase